MFELNEGRKLDLMLGRILRIVLVIKTGLEELGPQTQLKNQMAFVPNTFFAGSSQKNRALST